MVQRWLKMRTATRSSPEALVQVAAVLTKLPAVGTK